MLVWPGILWNLVSRKTPHTQKNMCLCPLMRYCAQWKSLMAFIMFVIHIFINGIEGACLCFEAYFYSNILEYGIPANEKKNSHYRKKNHLEQRSKDNYVPVYACVTWNEYLTNLLFVSSFSNQAAIWPVSLGNMEWTATKPALAMTRTVILCLVPAISVRKYFFKSNNMLCGSDVF